MKLIYLLPFFFLTLGIAYAQVTINNANFEFDTFNLNVTTPITVDSFLQEPTGFTTSNGESLRKYNFFNSTLIPFDVHWDVINSTMAQYTITPANSDVNGTVTGANLTRVELDGVSVSWTYTTLSTVFIGTNSTVEYWFDVPVTPILSPTLNAIYLRIAPPTDTRLGGVLSALCDYANNYTMVGIYTNGSLACIQWSVGPAP